MYASTITKALTAGAATNIALSQSLAAAGNLTLNGAAVSGGVAILDTQRRVIITSGGNDTGINWTIIGTDETGNAVKDVFAGVSGGAAQSNLDFKTVTSIAGSGAAASTVTAGTNTVGSSPWKMFTSTIQTPNIGFDLELVSGSGTATVEYTQEEFLQAVSTTGAQSSIANGGASPNPTPHGVSTALTGAAASAQGAVNTPMNAWRLTIMTGTGTWRLTGRQAGMASP